MRGPRGHRESDRRACSLHARRAAANPRTGLPSAELFQARDTALTNLKANRSFSPAPTPA